MKTVKITIHGQPTEKQPFKIYEILEGTQDQILRKDGHFVEIVKTRIIEAIEKDLFITINTERSN